MLLPSSCNFDHLATSFKVTHENSESLPLPQHFNQARLLKVTHHFKNGTMRNCDYG